MANIYTYKRVYRIVRRKGELVPAEGVYIRSDGKIINRPFPQPQLKHTPRNRGHN